MAQHVKECDMPSGMDTPGVSASTSSWPPTARPWIRLCIASGLGAVQTITFAPPSLESVSAWSTFELSIYSCAPRSAASCRFESEEDSATVRYPILRANWTARWPRPLSERASVRRMRTAIKIDSCVPDALNGNDVTRVNVHMPERIYRSISLRK